MVIAPLLGSCVGDGKQDAPVQAMSPGPSGNSRSADRGSAVHSRSRSTSMAEGAEDDVRISAITSRSISENSIAVHPLDPNVVLCAHNSILYPSAASRGIQIGWSVDGGASWTTLEVETAFADPATAIDRDGNFYVGYINTGSSQSVHVSRDRGATWQRLRVATRVESLGGDKNHMVVDTGAASPFQGRLYAAWTDLRGAPPGHLRFTASADGGESWTPVRDISSGLPGGAHMGVNLQTGPGGELYACWAIYPAGAQQDETAIGFNASFDGGATFVGPTTALSDVRGIRVTRVPNTDIRANSFPSMAVDRSEGPRRGWIYVFWTNLGVPGVNDGDADVYVARSRDAGFTWDPPVRVNDDSTGNAQWQVWGCCDAANGDLYAVFLDRRADPEDRLARTTLARSTDGGASWVDLPVGDVPFVPRSIPNIAGYMGDYLGIAAGAGRVYPLWSDWREDPLTAYTSPVAFDILPPLVSCPAARTVEATAAGGAPRSDPALAEFLEAVQAQDESDPSPEISHDAPDFFPLGETVVTFTALDDAGNTARCSAAVTVVDTTPPAFELGLRPSVLAPVDRRLVPIDVSALVTDVCDPEAGFVLASITSSDPDRGTEPDDLPDDIQEAELGTPDTHFLLRSERSPRTPGRTYTIKYAARDASGNTRARSLIVQVGAERKR